MAERCTSREGGFLMQLLHGSQGSESAHARVACLSCVIVSKGKGEGIFNFSLWDQANPSDDSYLRNKKIPFPRTCQGTPNSMLH